MTTPVTFSVPSSGKLKELTEFPLACVIVNGIAFRAVEKSGTLAARSQQLPNKYNSWQQKEHAFGDSSTNEQLEQERE